MAVTVTEGTPNTTAAANFDVAIPSHDAGDLLVLMVAKNQGSSSAPSISTAGWHTEVIQPGATGSNHILVGWKEGDGAEDEVRVTNMAAGTLIGKVLRAQNADVTSPVIGTSDTENSAGGTATSSKTFDVGTAAAGQLGVSVICWASATSSPNVTNSYVLDETTGFYGLAHKVLTDTDDSIDWSWTTARNWRACLVVFKEASNVLVTPSTVATTSGVGSPTVVPNTIVAATTVAAKSYPMWLLPSTFNEGSASQVGNTNATQIGGSTVVSGISVPGTAFLIWTSHFTGSHADPSPALDAPSGWSSVLSAGGSSAGGSVWVRIWARIVHPGETIDTGVSTAGSCDTMMSSLYYMPGYGELTAVTGSLTNDDDVFISLAEMQSYSTTGWIAGYALASTAEIVVAPGGGWSDYLTYPAGGLSVFYAHNATAPYGLQTSASWILDTAVPHVAWSIRVVATPVTASGIPTPGTVAGVFAVPSVTKTATATLTPSTVATAATAPAPTVSSVTNTTVALSTVATVGAVGAATASASASAAPATVATTTGGMADGATTSYISIATSAGTVVWRITAGTVLSSTVTPASVGGVFGVPPPSLVATATFSITTVPTNGAVPSATVSSSPVVTPNTVAAPLAVPAPTVSAVSNASHTTGVVGTVSAVPSVAVTASSTVTPATVGTTSAIEAPTISSSTSSTVELATVATLGGVPSLTISASVTVSAGVATTTAIGAEISTTALVTPATVSTLSTQPEVIPSIGINAVAEPATVATSSAVGSVSLTATATLTPATVAGVGAVGSVAVLGPTNVWLTTIALPVSIGPVALRVDPVVARPSVGITSTIGSTVATSPNTGPATASTTTSIPAVTILVVSDATATPATVATTSDVPSLTYSASASVAPATVGGVSGVGAEASVREDATVPLATVASVCAVPTIEVLLADRPTPATVGTTTSIAASVRVDCTITPPTVASVAAVGGASTLQSITQPATVVGRAGVPMVTIVSSPTVTPATVATITPNPTTRPNSTLILEIATVATSASIPSAALSCNGRVKARTVNCRFGISGSVRTDQPVLPSTVSTRFFVHGPSPRVNRHLMAPEASSHRTRHHMPDRANWTVLQQQRSNREALHLLGEYTMFVLLWTDADRDAGLVQTCQTCLTDENVLKAYGQARKIKCPDCFGTTFSGGFRAKIIRPALWDTNSKVLREEGPRGQETVRTASVQSTSDFRMNVGDWVVRADGSRWQVQSVSRTSLHTGFEHITPDDVLGNNFGNVVEEPGDSPAFLVPPDTPAIRTLLDRSMIRYPIDYEGSEVIRGSLA